MAELPTGTVTMVFSDIEGSTLLLSRLGLAYTDALDGQRQVLRNAWTANGGMELGTEGDSFFVAFATAPEAVAAATQAQRELAGFRWPEDERVRVRMGVHTGSPTVHDGGYVGMDVHRAARIAGSAHGGQVVVSDATAHLVKGCLPDGVGLRDLGAHQLKDIAQPEHLFQLAIDGLEGEFPPLKTLGAVSSLPVPATPLVGRDGELAELTALLDTPEVRLVTLIGTGGAGKTRLAIGLAQSLIDRFPDGVYFVPLAAVTAAEAMWTTIAEVLGLPSEGRTPPGFFDHVAQRSTLLVLDNLEQLLGADRVVSELLRETRQVVVISTSRRVLNVAGEHVHPVPPLGLPDPASPEDVASSGAVRLFVQQARMARPTFALTPENSADVTKICRRLDGLPLAIELAAARTRVLGPTALLARLDQALELNDAGVDRPTRQQTLRDTLDWSYDLLTPTQQALFRNLGVFASGADINAIEAVATSVQAEQSADLLDVVADLADASLITVTETPDGEPRIELLETVRAYALDQLTVTGDVDEVRERHAHHYLEVAELWKPLLLGDDYLPPRARFESEHDNFREALRWALRPGRTPPSRAGGTDTLGLRLTLALFLFWYKGGYLAEQRPWLEQAIAHAGGAESPELARCHRSLAWVASTLGDLDSAHDHATASVNICRRLNDSNELGRAVGMLAWIEMERGQSVTARSLFDEELKIARTSGDKRQLMDSLFGYASFEYSEPNFGRFKALNDEAIALARELGDSVAVLQYEHNSACALRRMGQVEEAQNLMRDSIPRFLQANQPESLVELAEGYAAVLAELGNHQLAIRLLGAADAMRERLAIPCLPMQQAEIAEPINKTRATFTAHEWDEVYQAGRNTTVEDALAEAHAAQAPT